KWTPRSTSMWGRSGLNTVGSCESPTTTCAPPGHLGRAGRARLDQRSQGRGGPGPGEHSQHFATRESCHDAFSRARVHCRRRACARWRDSRPRARRSPASCWRTRGKEAALAHAIELKLPQRVLLLRQRLLCECSFLYGLEPGPKFGVLRLRGFHGLFQPLFFLLQDCGAFFQGLHRDHKHPRHVGGRNGRWCSDGADAIVPEGGKELLGDRTVVAGLVWIVANGVTNCSSGSSVFLYATCYCTGLVC